MGNDIAISARGVSKAYTIAHNAQRSTTVGELLAHKLRNPFQRPETETFWALKDVSFDVKKGDVVGIIGRNGAGKSTLLKILSRITEPTSGEIDIYGRVGSLLEVGTGFHQELTGRENIYLNGAILGMNRAEIDRQFDAIVEFSEIENFLDTPVKRYSSGMYVRLAFAVAAHLNPEILVIDEVLAVGDSQFQQKCLGKMGEVSKEGGRTVLFVSHNMGAIQVLCNKALILKRGTVEHAGPVDECVQKYIETGQSGIAIASHLTLPNPRFKVLDVTLNGEERDEFVLRSDVRDIELAVEFECFESIGVDFEVVISDIYDQPLAFFGPSRMGDELPVFDPGVHVLTRQMRLPVLAQGNYMLDIDLAHPNACYWARFPHAVTLRAEGSPSPTGRVLEVRERKGWIVLEQTACAGR